MGRIGLAIFSFLACAAAAKDLNQIAIHYQYGDGDFPSVIKAIDEFTATHKKYARADSIFIAKHLAVVYSANPETREKGKYYMYRLLELVPSAELVDMYVSEEIDRIFSRVREEYRTHHQEQAQARERERNRIWRNPWTWAGGAAAAGLLGFIIYEAVAPSPKGRPEYVVP
jgi:hypothetical protein